MSHFIKRKYFLTLTIAFAAMSALVVGCGDDDDDNNAGTAGSGGSGGSATAGSANGGVAGSTAGSATGGTATSGSGGTTGGTTGGTESTPGGAAGSDTTGPTTGGTGTDMGDAGHQNGGTGPIEAMGGAGAGPGPGPGFEGGAGGAAGGAGGAVASSGGAGGEPESFGGAAGAGGASPTCTNLTMEQTASAATQHNHITDPGEADLQSLVNTQPGPITFDLPTQFNHSHKITLTAGNVTTLRNGGEVSGVLSTGVTPPVPGTVPAHDHTYTISCD